MARANDCDHVISTGTLWNDAIRVDYYTTTPAPDQWVAVGVMVDVGSPNARSGKRKLLVGNGSSEADAIADLKHCLGKALSARVIATSASAQPDFTDSAANLPPSIAKQEQSNVDDTASIHQ